MPIQFSTQAANADVMGKDAQTSGTSEGMTDAIGADGTPRDRSDRTPERKGGEAKAGETREAEQRESEAKPGKDINAAGFVKDKDAAKP